MLVNIVLIIFAVVGGGVLIFFLSCMYKQYRGSKDISYIELFPKQDIYAENAYEDVFNMFEDKEQATTQRESAGISYSMYFTPDEYIKYREKVLKTKLP